MTQYEKAQIEEAKKESKFSASQLLSEIELLLPECFLCGFNREGDALRLEFHNGQSFKLTVSEGERLPSAAANGI